MKNFLTFSFLFFAHISFSQTFLQGILTDGDTSEPIFFGTVAVYKNGKLITTAETDYDGFYSIEIEKAGIYDIEYLCLGYPTITVNGFKIIPNETNNLDAQFPYQPNPMGPIITIMNIPFVKVDGLTQGFIFSAEEIRRMPHRGQ